MQPRTNLLTRVNLEMALYAGLLLLAAALRLWGLGLRPLSAGESEHALAAWQLYWGLDYAPREPLYLLTTLGSFGWLGISDAAARLVPALAGVALVALPALLHRQLGRLGALAAAALLAVSPSFVFLSDSADGTTLALGAGLLLTAALWRYRESGRPAHLYLAAGGLGLALAASSAAYPLVLMLAIFAGVFLVTGRAPRPDRALIIRTGLVLGAVLVVASTVALTRLDGLQEVLVTVPGRWLTAFWSPRTVPWEHALRLLALYDVAALVLGATAMGFLLARPAWLVEFTPALQDESRGEARGPWAVFLILWALVAFLLTTLADSTQTAPIVLPLILLAGLFVDQLWAEGLTWTRTRGLLVVFALAFLYVMAALVRLVVWQDQAGSELTLAACLIILTITVLYWTWAARPRWLGLSVVGAVLLVLSLHGATYLIFPPTTGPRDFLDRQPVSSDIRLFQADLGEAAFMHRANWTGLDVTIIGEPDPVWDWLLRDHVVTYTTQPGDEFATVIIAPVEWQAALDEALPGYTRRQYTQRIEWPGDSFSWSTFIEWLLYRYSAVPPYNHEYVVYIRQ
ncbi:MAG: hypothetical protein KKA73_07350 [Chloroflexi bacterium]|nr:hypothetical protein [Chloroflexota bacterium]